MPVTGPSATPLTLDAVAARLIAGIWNCVTRAMYGKAIRDFLAWHVEQASPHLSRPLLETYRTHLASSNYSASSINQRLTAIRKLILRAGDEGLLPVEQALVVTRVHGVRKRGVRPATWLTPEQAEVLVRQGDASSPRCWPGAVMNSWLRPAQPAC